MTLDLVLWAPDRATLRAFAENRLIQEVVDDGEGGTTRRFRPGFEWTFWNGNGRLMRTPFAFRLSTTVDNVQGSLFGFAEPPSLPTWLDDTTTIYKDGNLIGTYDRIAQGFVVYNTVAGETTPTIGETVEVYSGPTFVPGVLVIMRISGARFMADRIPADMANDDDGDPISVEDRAEQWGRSRIARWIKKNGTQGTNVGITYYEVDGVRIMRAQDVQERVAAWGVPGHQWLGGNSF